MFMCSCSSVSVKAQVFKCTRRNVSVQVQVRKCQCVSVSVEVSVFKGFSGRTLRNAFGKNKHPAKNVCELEKVRRTELHPR